MYITVRHSTTQTEKTMMQYDKVYHAGWVDAKDEMAEQIAELEKKAAHAKAEADELRIMVLALLAERG